jgi:hypothetical protein
MEKTLNILKIIGVSIVALFVIFILIFIFTIKPKLIEPSIFQDQINDLKEENVQIKDEQTKISEITDMYNRRIDSLNLRIDSVKEKTVVIKKYYHEKIQEVNSYNDTDVDNFLKNRYEY